MTSNREHKRLYKKNKEATSLVYKAGGTLEDLSRKLTWVSNVVQ